MGDAARQRLLAERKALTASRPLGCWARPRKAPDGSLDLMVWEVGIVPRQDSAYALPEGETLRLTFSFSADYPLKAPVVRFAPAIFHTNVFPDGRVCLSLLLEKGHHADAATKHVGHWQPSLTIANLLTAMIEVRTAASRPPPPPPIRGVRAQRAQRCARSAAQHSTARAAQRSTAQHSAPPGTGGALLLQTALPVPSTILSSAHSFSTRRTRACWPKQAVAGAPTHALEGAPRSRRPPSLHTRRLSIANPEACALCKRSAKDYVAEVRRRMQTYKPS